jgi:hypothetical protein
MAVKVESKTCFLCLFKVSNSFFCVILSLLVAILTDKLSSTYHVLDFFITYEWANAVFQKKFVVEKTGVTKYSIEERLKLDHQQTSIPKRSVHVCLSSFCFKVTYG